jgi:hypothetical protein
MFKFYILERKNRPHFLIASPFPFSTMPPNANISKKRKFVADGVFYAELNEVGLKRRSWAPMLTYLHADRHPRSRASCARPSVARGSPLAAHAFCVCL